MKRFLSLLIIVYAVSSFASERAATIHVQKLFLENVRTANDMLKRGNYEQMAHYQKTLADVREHLHILRIYPQILEDLNTYDQTVRNVTASLQKNAPTLKQDREALIRNLEAFNKRLASIGLFELLHGWQDLTRTKREFVRVPQKKLKKAFDTQWLYVNTLIQELYLDEEYETPILEFLIDYKKSFDVMATAYQETGYQNVANLKPLSYKIKADLLMIPRG